MRAAWRRKVGKLRLVGSRRAPVIEGLFTLLALQGAPDPQPSVLPLAALREGLEAVGSFTGPPGPIVTRGGPPSLLVERVHGLKGPSGWVQFTSWRSPGGLLRLSLPEAPSIAVHSRDLRLHLPPLDARTFGPADAAGAPASVRETLRREGGPVTLEVYALRAATRYHVRVAVETYHLPPDGPEGHPETASHTVLWVSDRPFVQGRPTRPLTPAGLQHTY
jgi:hypothetical protein